MTRDEWLALAERCEKATGPDREIDAAIMFDAFAEPVGVMSDGGPRAYLWPDDDPAWNFGMRFPGKDRDWFYQRRPTDEKETLLLERDGALVLMNDVRIPRLTGSLDAITALIEREFPLVDFHSSRRRNIRGDFDYEAHILYGLRTQGLGQAATEALARCAAFCRAEAEKGERG